MNRLPQLPTRSVGFFLTIMVAALFSLGCSDSTTDPGPMANPLSVFTTTGSTSGTPTNGTTQGVGTLDQPIVTVPIGNDGRRDHTNAPLLDNWHPGWQQAECLSCHTDQSRIPDHSYPDTSMCYLCHGTNGLPGFGDNVPPVIKSVVAAPNYTGVAVSWITDEPCITRLILRTTAGDKMEFPVSQDYSQSHRYVVNGLLTSTTYEYEIIALDKNNNKSTTTTFGKLYFTTVTQATTTTTNPTDPTNPTTTIITGPSVSDIDSFSCVATWKTSIPTTCTLEVIDTVLGGNETIDIGGPATDFSRKVIDLLAGRKYYLVVHATDQTGQVYDGSRTEFTTDPL